MTRYRCTPNERMFCLVNDLHNGEGMFTSGIRVRGAVDAERLQDALQRLQARHAKLRCRLEYDKSGWPWFVEMDPLVRIPCEFRETSDLAEAEYVLLHAWPDKFPIDRSPPVQLIILKCTANDTTDIIGWFHHTAFDAIAVWQFFEELLQAYADPNACREPAPPGFGVLGKIKLTLWGNLFWLCRIIWRRRMTGGLRPVKTFCRRPITGTAFRRTVLSTEMTRRIVQACHRENVTVTSAVAAAGCKVLAKEFSWHGEPIALPTPRDLRAQFDPPVKPGTFGCFASIYEVVLPLPTLQEDFWEVARRYVTEAKRQFHWKDLVRRLHLVKHIPERMVQRAGAQRGALIVNNLGRVTSSGAPGVPEIVDYYAYARTKKLGSSALVLAAGTTNDRMSVTLATGCFDQATIDRLQANIVNELDQATHPADSPHNSSSHADSPTATHTVFAGQSSG